MSQMEMLLIIVWTVFSSLRIVMKDRQNCLNIQRDEQIEVIQFQMVFLLFHTGLSTMRVKFKRLCYQIVCLLLKEVHLSSAKI